MSRRRGVEFTDPELIGEIRGGSSVAFERLMQRYERLVYKVALGFTGDPEAALDVSQNVFLRAHTKLATWRGDGPLKNWIVRMTMNESMNWNRGQRRHREVGLDEEVSAGPEAPQEERLRLRETCRLVHHLLDALSPKQRLAVVLRYFDGMPVRDIAAVLECTEGVAKNVLFRSLKRMRAHIDVSTEVPS